MPNSMHSNAFNEFGTHFDVPHFSNGFVRNFKEESTCEHLCISRSFALFSLFMFVHVVHFTHPCFLYVFTWYSFFLYTSNRLLVVIVLFCLFVVYCHISRHFFIIFPHVRKCFCAARCFLWSDRGSAILSPGTASVMVLLCWPWCSL